MSVSNTINTSNVSNIYKEIERKKSWKPYFASENTVTNVITDYDVFPYPRWFRGIPSYTKPVIAEREAGYRPREDNCYDTIKKEIKVSYPNNCFQSACSTVFPCYPPYESRYAQKDELDIILNQNCIAQYR